MVLQSSCVQVLAYMKEKLLECDIAVIAFLHDQLQADLICRQKGKEKMLDIRLCKLQK